MSERLFTYPDFWGDSAGFYAAMPIKYNNKDCYIMLDSDDVFGIYDNNAIDLFMPEDMVLTGNLNDDDLDYEIRTYLKMLKILRDAWR